MTEKLQKSAKKIRIGWIFLATIISQIVILSGHVLFVAIFAHFVQPGQEQAVYDQFAHNTGSSFSILFGPFIFFFSTLWVGKKAKGNFLLHATLMVVLYTIIDASILIAVEDASVLKNPVFTISQTAKLIGAYLGARTAKKQVQND